MWYYPGDVLVVRVRGVIHHEGIVTETGRVISNSRRRGGVFEESLRTFADGKSVDNRGSLSGLSSEAVLANARARIGRRYNPISYNCEHFVRDCYGLRPHSPQKKLALGAVALAALAFIF